MYIVIFLYILSTYIFAEILRLVWLHLTYLLHALKIIIIDNYSTDKTTEIAKQYTNQIYSYKNPGNQDKGYYKFALSLVKTDYVYFASAAEIVPLALLK